MLYIKKDTVGGKVLKKLYITNTMEDKEMRTEVDSSLIEDATMCRLNTNSHEAIIEYGDKRIPTGLSSKEVLRYFSLL